MSEKVNPQLSIIGVPDTESPLPSYIPAEWFQIDRIIGWKSGADRLTLSCLAGENPVELTVTMPSDGGVRIHGECTGYFTPHSVKPFKTVQIDNGVSAELNGKKTELFFSDGSLCVKNGEVTVALKLSLGFNKAGKTVKTQVAGKIHEGEYFCGLGERFNGFVQNGACAMLWNIDPYIQNMSDDPISEKNWSYNNVPLLHSTEGYSIFFNSTYSIVADIGHSDSDVYSLEANGAILDLYIWFGETRRNLKGYTALTGAVPVPPKWAFRYWAGNDAHVWRSRGEDQSAALVEEVMHGYERLGTPIAALYGEGRPEKDPDSYSVLKRYGTRMLGWWDSGLWQPDEVYEYIPDCKDEDFPVVRNYRESNEIMKGNYLDFTNPNAELLLERKLKKFFDYGLKGAMIDIADCISVDSIYKNGMTGDSMHNFYAYLYTKTFSGVFHGYLSNDCVMFARPGCAGSQRWMANFVGDHPATFTGMKQSLNGAMSISASGFSVWGSDMGGLGAQPYNPEVYRRWIQWSAFNPLMRAHGQTERNPWNYGEAAERDFKKYYWLRENILDITYSGAIESNKNSTAMTQPLMIAFPGEKQLYTVGDEYLYCNELLVAPVTDSGVVSRPVVLPGGLWIDFLTGENINGGRTIDADAPIDKIPVYLRSGTVLPLRLPESLRLCESMPLDAPIRALMITPADMRREVCYHYDEGKEQSFITQRTENGELSVEAVGGCNVHVILAKGIAASAVTADGESVRRQEKAAPGICAFAVDSGELMTRIVLKKDWEKIKIVF